MSQARSDEHSSVSEANIPATSLVADYTRRMGTVSEAARVLESHGEVRVGKAATNGNGEKLNNAECVTMGLSAGEGFRETVSAARNNGHRHGMLHEEQPLEIQCGEKTALLFVSKLCQGSKGPCILYGNEWLTPNELQYICGRETAKDWKRSIRHKGKSLKSLIAQGFLKVHPPICDCPGCRVSSPVNRSRLADKCGFSKLPSYLGDKSMAEGFPTMWRRSSTSSDEPDQANSLQGSESFADDEPQPKRSHSDEPRYYRPPDQVHAVKRPRSSSPDLDRGRINIKRRCLSETCVDQPCRPADDEGHLKTNVSPTTHHVLTAEVEGYRAQEQKCDTTDQEVKREQHGAPTGTRSSLRRDLPVLTLPTTAYAANVLYGHNLARRGLPRHVTSPRILSPSFVRPSSASTAQIRLLHEQAAAPLSSHIYAHQLRQEYPNVGMATMFPYSFTHPLPSSQLLSSHFHKVTPDIERQIATKAEPSGTSPSSGKGQHDQGKTESKDSDQTTGKNKLSPGGSHGLSSPKEGTINVDGSGQSSLGETLKYSADEAGEQATRLYSELANIAAQWDVDEVCKFVSSVTGCGDYCEVFREQEIDGQALILLTEDHLSNKMGIKLGPALKIKSKIDELRCVYTK